MAESPQDNEIAQRILHEAVRLFAAKGFSGTSTREIVETAATTKPMLYYYFKSKDGLLKAALASYIRELCGEMERALQSGLDPKRNLIEFVWAVFQFCQRNPDFVRLGSALLYGPEGAAAGVDIRSFARKAHAPFATAADIACKSGIARPGREEALATMLDGAIAAWTIFPQRADGVTLTHELAQQVVDDVLYGFAQ